jgi:nucleotide-binding universal stress UspA family protein
MYQRILIGIDFSDSSIETVRWAVSRFPSADLVLFHCIERFSVPGYVVRELGDRLDLLEEKELDVRQNLEHIAERLGIDVCYDVRQGWTPEALQLAAAEHGSELIVVGAHQHRMSPMDELGQTCAAIVRKSDVPVLVWRPIRAEKDKTIVAALDLREGSAPVAATAAEYAAYFKTRLVLLHAMPSTLQAYMRAVSSPAKVEEVLERIEARAREEALASVPAEMRKRLQVQPSVVRGRPIVGHILSTAEAEHADLIVIGKAHAPGRKGRVLLGGTTTRVIRGANCSVLTVPL